MYIFIQLQYVAHVRFVVCLFVEVLGMTAIRGDESIHLIVSAQIRYRDRIVCLYVLWFITVFLGV